MTYTKFDFARELSKQLNLDCENQELAKWAYRTYLDNANDLEDGLFEEIMRIVALEEGGQFELKRSDIRKIVRRLLQA